MVYSGFEHHYIIDGDITNTAVFVPAWLSTSGNGLIHDVVRHEEGRL
jgi:hypothetical protein